MNDIVQTREKYRFNNLGSSFRPILYFCQLCGFYSAWWDQVWPKGKIHVQCTHCAIVHGQIGLFYELEDEGQFHVKYRKKLWKLSSGCQVTMHYAALPMKRCQLEIWARFLPQPPFSWALIISHKILGFQSLCSFMFKIYLGLGPSSFWLFQTKHQCTMWMKFGGPVECSS